ncbi:hypothetical protein L1887_47424 [Cichorium endivia]|nr:hypothetical protein L1887_47424 [Cichorium endivia]
MPLERANLDRRHRASYSDREDPRGQAQKEGAIKPSGCTRKTKKVRQTRPIGAANTGGLCATFPLYDGDGNMPSSDQPCSRLIRTPKFGTQHSEQIVALLAPFRESPARRCHLKGPARL